MCLINWIRKRTFSIGLLLFLLGQVIEVKGQIVIKDDLNTLTGAQIYQNIDSWLPQKNYDFRFVKTSADSFLRISNLSPWETPNFGFQKKSIWLKFQIRNASPQKMNLRLSVGNPNLDIAELFIVSPIGQIDSFIRGKLSARQNELIKAPDYVFPLVLSTGQQYTCYLKLRSKLPLFVPLAINQPKVQFNSSFLKNAISFSFAMIVLVMIIYNGFIAIATKDKSYYYYVGYLLFLGLTQLGLSGFSYIFLWPRLPRFDTYATLLFSCLGGIFALLFSLDYLRLDINRFKKTFQLARIFIFFFLISILFALLGFWQLSFQIMQGTTFVASIFLLIVSYLRIKHNRDARYFFGAWATLLLASLLFILKDYGIIPASFFMMNIVQLGSVIEILLLSLGLANRINNLRRERDSYRARELNALRDNKRLIEGQNIILNRQVAKRTQELQKSNQTLTRMMEHLKAAQTQLIASEKMSSLGQLTAGIAHEINNPINFVTANIVPLKRDIKQLMDSMEFMGKIGFDQKLNKEQKMEKIAQYKEEIELDYIKEEIGMMLEGIQEGAGRTADIVKGLRTFARVDEATFKEADINNGIKTTLSLVGNLLKGINLKTNFGSLPLVFCNPGKLNQVFLNIITNATQAIKEKFQEGDNEGTLEITTNSSEQGIEIRIKDNGIGMTEATKEKLFEPFFTTKPIGVGTGLGMSIVFSILQEHHAQIQVMTQRGIGTTFEIFLPNAPIDKP